MWETQRCSARETKRKRTRNIQEKIYRLVILESKYIYIYIHLLRRTNLYIYKNKTLNYYTCLHINTNSQINVYIFYTTWLMIIIMLTHFWSQWSALADSFCCCSILSVYLRDFCAGLCVDERLVCYISFVMNIYIYIYIPIFYIFKTESVLKHTLIFINHHKNLFGDPVKEFQFIKNVQYFRNSSWNYWNCSDIFRSISLMISTRKWKRNTYDVVRTTTTKKLSKVCQYPLEYHCCL